MVSYQPASRIVSAIAFSALLLVLGDQQNAYAAPGRIFWTDSTYSEAHSVRSNGTDDELLLFSVCGSEAIDFDNLNNTLYIADRCSKVMRADPDGSNAEVLLHAPTRNGATYLAGIAVDGENGKFYVTDQNRIFRADIDGSNMEIILTNAANGIVMPDGIALDVPNNKIWWVDLNNKQINSSDLDGSNSTTHLFLSGTCFPSDISLDLNAGYAYFGNCSWDQVLKWNINSSNDETVISGAPWPSAIEVDAAQNTFFWADTSLNKIQRAGLDGTNVQDVVTSGASNVRSLTLDTTAQKLFFAEYSTASIKKSSYDGSNIETILGDEPSANGSLAVDSEHSHLYFWDAKHASIARMSASGTNVEQIVSIGTSQTVRLTLDLESATQKIYWTTATSGKVQRANLDGSNVEDLVTGLTSPRGIALDIAGGKMYWSSSNGQKIQRADLDGTAAEDIVTGLSYAEGIAVDHGAGKVYWSNPNLHTIHRANLDGTSIETIVSSLGYPRDLALDTEAGKLYWADDKTHKLQRANLDGSGVEDVLSSDTMSPFGIALLFDSTSPEAPVIASPSNNSLTNDSTPAISGTAEADSTVTLYDGDTELGQTVTNGSGEWNFTPGTGLSQGLHQFKAKATDQAENSSGFSSVVNVTIDSTSPEAPVIASPSNNSLTNDSTPAISGTAEADSTVTLYDGDTELGQTVTNGSGEWNFTPGSSLSDGQHQFKAKATDQAENTSPFSNTRTVTIDSSAPQAPLITSPANNSLTTDNTPTVSGTAEVNSTVDVYINNVKRGTALTNSSGAWVFTTSTQLSNGSYTFKAKAKDAAGNIGIFSAAVRITINTELDSDNDGRTDLDEILDGTDPNDRGSVMPELGTTVCAEWNGFLGPMINIMEHVNMSSSQLGTQSTIYDIYGAPQSSLNFWISPGAQFDLLVHDMHGFAENSYGQVCSTHSGGTGDLDGRIVYYKTAPQSGSLSLDYDFAFALPFTSGTRGSQFVPFNTFQPSLNPADLQNVVANWIQLTNLKDSSQTGSMYFYDQQGTLLNQVQISLLSGERRDFAAHQFGPNLVGVIEWRPDDDTSEFQLRNVRYYYDSADIGRERFMTASQFGAQVGCGRPLVVPLDTQGSTAIIEISNTLDEEITVNLKLYFEDGTLAEERTITLPSHASEHVITDLILNSRQGIAVIDGSKDESVIATAMQYGRDDFGGITSMYGIPAVEPLGTVLRSSYNTFLSQGCRLFVENPASSQTTVTIDMTRSDGTAVLSGHQEIIPPKGLLNFDLCAQETSDNYGVVTVQPSSANSVAGSVLRIGHNSQYRFPTPLRQ